MPDWKQWLSKRREPPSQEPRRRNQGVDRTCRSSQDLSGPEEVGNADFSRPTGSGGHTAGTERFIREEAATSASGFIRGGKASSRIHNME